MSSITSPASRNNGALKRRTSRQPAWCQIRLACSSSLDVFRHPGSENLKPLPIFPCEDGGVTSVTACQCFFPASVVGPRVRLQVRLLKRGSWEALLKKLNVGELTVRSLIEQALVPGYAALDEQ